MEILRIFFLSLVLASCNAPQAVYDYDERVDHSQFRSYDFYPELVSGLSPLDEDRLRASLELGMRNKVISKADPPDLFLNFYTEEYQQRSRNNLGIGIGGGGGNIGVGVSGGIPLGGSETYLRLTFDLIDAQNDELIWQAVVDSEFDRTASPKQRRSRFDKIVAKALEGYPPEK